jgi:hypothetical protein
MAQHDMNIANQGFPAFRSDLNDALAALVSNSSGATAPSTTFAHQMWVDTAADPSVLKIRNADNDAWITIGTIDQTGDKFVFSPAGGSASQVAYGVAGEIDTGMFFPASDTIAFAEGGAEAMRIDSSGRVGIGTSSPTFPLMVVSSGDTQVHAETTGATGYIIQKNSGGAAGIFSTGNNLGFFTSALGTERARITSGGDLLVATTTVNSSSGITLNASGYIVAKGVYNTLVSASTRDIYMDIDGYFGYISSTRNSKTNIADITDVSWLYSLSPVSFNYKQFDRETKQYVDEPAVENQYGLIAEDVEPINSELCFYDETENGKELRGVSYTKLITPMLKAIQELKAELDTVKTELATLKGQ